MGAQLCLTVCSHVDRESTRLLCPRNFPGKVTGGVGISFSSGSVLSELFTDLSILGGPELWLIASLSYANPFTRTRLWSMKEEFLLLHINFTYSWASYQWNDEVCILLHLVSFHSTCIQKIHSHYMCCYCYCCLRTSIPLYGYIVLWLFILFYYLGYFHIWAVINNAAINRHI